MASAVGEQTIPVDDVAGTERADGVGTSSSGVDPSVNTLLGEVLQTEGMALPTKKGSLRATED